MKHTQGPWEIRPNFVNGTWINSVDGSPIVFLPKHVDDEAGKPCGSISSQDKTNEEIQANARLIAAAPDMLDMLKTIDLRLDIEKNEGKINYILSATHNDIKELIKKAEVSE